MSRQRIILHADMDAFYASVEQRDHPELRGKPVIIGARSARGVVSAASYEARAFGVRSAMPGFRAKELCPHGVFLGGDMKKYAAVSRKVHAIFRDFTDQIEPLALDEAFLDVSGSVHLFGDPETLGRSLKERVKHELDLVVSVGIAPNKLVAKIACTQGKPDGLLVIAERDIEALLSPLPIRSLWGIGPKTAQRLERAGFRTISDIARSPLSQLRSVFGDHAQAMQKRARGEDDREVVSERLARSIGEEATFSEDVSDPRKISSAITVHSETVAARARRAGYVGDTVVLKVKLARRRRHETAAVASHELFPIMSRQRRLSSSTSDGPTIRRAAFELWTKLGLGEPIRLLGVTLAGLTSAKGPRQLDLFEARAKATSLAPADAALAKRPSRSEQLGRTLDEISDRFGQGAIFRAAQEVRKVTSSDKIKIGDENDDDG